MADIKFSSLAGRLRRSEIRELLKLTRTPGTISFGGGLPDPKIFPIEPVKAATLRALEERGHQALQYSPTEGEPFLREALAAYMERQGEPARVQDIMVVSSSQQALDMIAKIFIDLGDPIIVERPTYVGALQSFRAAGADFHGVDMDDDGMIPARLKEKIVELAAQGKKPKFIYVIPDFQNPSGINLTLERRKEILALASRYDLIILEDSPYRALRFVGELIPSMRSLDQEHRVIQMKTFSKIFSPGFRLGWIVAPEAVLDKLIQAKQSTDLCTSAFVSIVAGYLVQDGHLEKQIAVSKELYVRKARTMLEAMDQHFPKIEGLSWSRPTGGMFLWVRLPKYMDALEMLHAAVKRQVAYVIGSAFYCDGAGKNELRLNYSYPTQEQIVEGIQRMADLIKERAK
jgi:2-aminoadipate transaminase